MAKIGIYVPDDRMEDIERWRERLNFSQIFMEAFDRATVAAAVLPKVKGKEMKGVIERLKKQAERDTERAWKRGAKDGREWAVKFAYYSHFRSIAEGRLTFDKPDSDVMDFLHHHYEHCGYVKTPDDEYGEYEADKYGDSETSRRGFNQGFVDAVKQVWEDIRVAFE